jgi:hypothetical protein
MSSPLLPEIESAAAPAVSPGLRRMRAIATGLLLLMLAIFVLSSMLQGRYPVLAYLRAFAEAATVGASADWFAVTALFRHPLGIPIPHTAIVPRNKQRIGEALGPPRQSRPSSSTSTPPAGPRAGWRNRGMRKWPRSASPVLCR